MRIARQTPDNEIAASNRPGAIGFDRTLKCGHHHYSQRQVPVAVPELAANAAGRNCSTGGTRVPKLEPRALPDAG